MPTWNLPTARQSLQAAGMQLPEGLSASVREVDLRGAPDSLIWEHARTQGFAIPSKDTDFRERSFVEGFPPKVIWLDVGNAGTARIAGLLHSERQRVERFEQSTECLASHPFNRRPRGLTAPTWLYLYVVATELKGVVAVRAT